MVMVMCSEFRAGVFSDPAADALEVLTPRPEEQEEGWWPCYRWTSFVPISCSLLLEPGASEALPVEVF